MLLLPIIIPWIRPEIPFIRSVPRDGLQHRQMRGDIATPGMIVWVSCNGVHNAY